MKKATLVVLAAGMGSRYGGLKQLDPFGPNGETIIDYSVYDAIRAGFGKVVFVIRERFIREFRKKISDKYKDKIEVELCCQEFDKLPCNYSVNPERVKPLGTGHAVWCAKGAIDGNFAVINADDFYGQSSFAALAAFLKTLDENDIGHQAMVGYELKNTLSENGFVSRGVCEVSGDGTLISITERTEINGGQNYASFFEGTEEYPISPDTIVSMNMMGFSKKAMESFEEDLREFLDANANELKAEFYLPVVLGNLIKRGYSEVKVLKTKEKWFGVTYPEDRPVVVSAINKLIEEGVYPSKLW